jgi:hypothetical protein
MPKIPVLEEAKQVAYNNYKKRTRRSVRLKKSTDELLEKNEPKATTRWIFSNTPYMLSGEKSDVNLNQSNSKEETIKKIAVMQAYVDGAEIEETHKYSGPDWNKIKDREPDWDWSKMDFRVGKDRIEIALDELRTGWPFMGELFMRGQCITLFKMLKALFPQAQAYYSNMEGHVYTRIDGKFYDIRGKHVVLPSDLHVLNWKEGDKPHRWPTRDKRVLTEREY